MIGVWMSIMVAYLLSWSITYAFVPYCRSVAQKFNILDHPNGTIKTHHVPTAYLGGVAVYLGFLVSLGLLFPFDNQFFLFFIGSTILFFVGLVDDLMPLSAGSKFLGQIVAVICFIKGGIYVKAHILHDGLMIFFSAIWMLLVINAFNLIDIMDGLATVTAFFCALTFFCIALLSGQYVISLLLAIFIGGLGAFFVYNAPRATIYLGDAGSLFIGGILSVIPFFINWGQFTYYGYLIPFVVLAIPLLEVTYLIIIRTYKMIPFYKPSPDHFALKLKSRGWSVPTILMIVAGASLILLTTSILFLLELISCATLVALGVAFVAFWTVGIYIW